MSKRHRLVILSVVIVGLFAGGIIIAGEMGKLYSTTGGFQPQALAPTAITAQSQTPDPRIAAYESLYGVEFGRRYCSAPCRNSMTRVTSGELITLGTWIDVFGAPDRVIGHIVFEPTQPNYFFVDIYYFNQRVQISAARRNIALREVTPDMSITEISLLSPQASPEQMAWELNRLELSGRLMARAQAWRGFGPVPVD